jgi:hypothetical protein
MTLSPVDRPEQKGAKTFAVDAASACCPQYVTST